MEKNSVRNWSFSTDDIVSVNDFNNIQKDDEKAVIPGQFGDDALIYNNYKNEKYIEYSAENNYDYAFFSENYCYTIKNNCEKISLINTDKKICDLFYGAGGFCLYGSKNSLFLSCKSVKKYEVISNQNLKGIKVFYDCNSICDYTEEMSNTYYFLDDMILINGKLSVFGIPDGLLSSKSYYERKTINPPILTKKRISYNWKYPENGDYAYKDMESVALEDKYPSMSVFTFIQDENSTKKIKIPEINTERLPLSIEKDAKKIDYSFNMRMIFEKNLSNSSYTALFKSRNLNFAVGISSVYDNHNSTLFYSKNINLNINISNITKYDTIFTLKYDIINHYNEKLDSHIFYNNNLKAFEQLNHNINISADKYGMYYMNLYVTTSKGEYRECYPFCILEKYDFKYRKTNPFGICSPHTDNKEQGEATAQLLNKIGITGIRLCRDGRIYDNDDISERLTKNGVTRQFIGIPVNNDPDKIDEYIDKVKKMTEHWINRVEYFLIANEADKYVKGNYDKSIRYIEKEYKPCTFNPCYDYITKAYPDKNNIVWESNCHASTEWLEAFHESGLFDKSSIIDIHSYSSPSGPDKIFNNQISNMFAQMYSNEYACVRWKRIEKRYGKKRMMVGETGYPSAPYPNLLENDIRTVADFNVRIALFFLEAGAEFINYFALYDRTSLFVGTSKWNEMYFGACYNCDYYGVYMPKPWAAALANLTRRFDGVISCQKFDKYDEDEFGTLRAFKVSLKDEKEFSVLWSNIYLLPNTTAQGRVNHTERIPMMAWENRWIINETREFDTKDKKIDVIDIMGNHKSYNSDNGKVSIKIDGSPIFVYGIY